MSATSSITYLAIIDGETQWNTPLYDLDAVTQAIYTRLNLFQGEWWADLNDGLPMWQVILGQAAGAKAIQQMEIVIGNVITGTPFVTGLANIAVSFNSTNRQFSFSAMATTPFGEVVIANYPIPPAAQSSSSSSSQSQVAGANAPFGPTFL